MDAQSRAHDQSLRFFTKDLLIDYRSGRKRAHEAPARRRPRAEQWRLAVGGLHRLRPATLLPHF